MNECIWNHIHLTNDAVMAEHKWKGNLDLINIIMLGLPNTLPGTGERYKLHRMLSALFSADLTAKERTDILANEYSIPADKEFRKELDTMCNLSQGILEKGVEQGKLQQAQETSLYLHRIGLDEKSIALAVSVSVTQVQEWLAAEQR